MPTAVRLVLIAPVALLGWQAVAGALELGRRAAAGGPLSQAECVVAGTDERLRRALGDDADLLADLRHEATPGTIVLTRRVTGSLEELRAQAKSEQELVATFGRLSARNGLLIQLTTFLFPAPYLLAVPDPIALAEQEAAAGRERPLFVLAGDPEPQGRAGWTCARRTARSSTWRFQKGS
ncbi:MAG: hypothetical protein WAT39_19150 [Planctomycetota bacterium]